MVSIVVHRYFYAPVAFLGCVNPPNHRSESTLVGNTSKKCTDRFGYLTRAARLYLPFVVDWLAAQFNRVGPKLGQRAGAIDNS